VIVVWRLTLAKYTHPLPDGTPPNLLSAFGASKYGGRWNHPGTSVVYTSGSVALCAMEVFVHLTGGVVPPNHVLIRIDVPDDVAAAAEVVAPPPSDWQRIPAPSSTRDLGTSWAASKRSLLLRVPSVVIPAEHNFLINPQHPDFGRISARVDSNFQFDPRMIARRP